MLFSSAVSTPHSDHHGFHLKHLWKRHMFWFLNLAIVLHEVLVAQEHFFLLFTLFLMLQHQE